jgi:hypothetical protein
MGCEITKLDSTTENEFVALIPFLSLTLIEKMGHEK